MNRPSYPVDIATAEFVPGSLSVICSSHITPAFLLCAPAVFTITFSIIPRDTHGRQLAAVELSLVRPSTAATPPAAGNAAVRIDKLQQHARSENNSYVEKQAEAAALVTSAKHNGWSLKQYYAQLLNKKLLPTVQEQCQGGLYCLFSTQVCSESLLRL